MNVGAFLRGEGGRKHKMGLTDEDEIVTWDGWGILFDGNRRARNHTGDPSSKLKRKSNPVRGRF